MKFLILGAGPAGLTFAAALKQAGENDFLILEKENEAGGLCRSTEVDGAPFDIGGGHFQDVRRPAVNSFLFQFMPEDSWNRFERDSRIFVNGTVINSPIEANIWQMDLEDQVEYLKAIAAAGCNTGLPMPERFTDWIFWKLGSRIAEDYMIPYNRKMFGEDLDSLGTYWLDKLPNVSFEETLRSCLTHRAYGTQPGHVVFLYPKQYGSGEVWLRVAESLGDRIRYNCPAEILDPENRAVNDSFEADIIINTVPWTSFREIRGLTPEEKAAAASLKHTSVVTEYQPEEIDTEAQWIYYPDPSLSYHRILIRHSFFEGARGYWTETNLERYRKQAGRTAFVNEYAYPLNTIGKQEKIAFLLGRMREHRIYGLGRWGEWQHFNSDAVTERALALASEFVKQA